MKIKPNEYALFYSRPLEIEDNIGEINLYWMMEKVIYFISDGSFITLSLHITTVSLLCFCVN